MGCAPWLGSEARRGERARGGVTPKQTAGGVYKEFSSGRWGRGGIPIRARVTGLWVLS